VEHIQSAFGSACYCGAAAALLLLLAVPLDKHAPRASTSRTTTKVPVSLSAARLKSNSLGTFRTGRCAKSWRTCREANGVPVQAGLSTQIRKVTLRLPTIPPSKHFNSAVPQPFEVEAEKPPFCSGISGRRIIMNLNAPTINP